MIILNQPNLDQMIMLLLDKVHNLVKIMNIYQEHH